MKWKLIKFIDTNAVLENNNGEQVTWPHNLLPVDYDIGNEFSINFNKLEKKLQENDESKQIINTILKTE